MPTPIADRQRALQLIGMALAACEKSVQIIYERNVRPAEKRHEPWVTRVTGQLLAACDGMEAALGRHALEAESSRIGQDGVSAAVSWHFMQQVIPEIVAASRYPRLCEFSARAETLAEFEAAPHGPDTYRN